MPFESLQRTKLYDFAAGLPVIAFYGWALWRDYPQLYRAYFLIQYGYVDAQLVASFAQRILSFGFAALLIALLLLRRVPGAKAQGIVPRFAATGGAFVGVLMLWLPAVELSLPLLFTSLAFLIIGTAMMIVSLAWLGRSFSVMPEARRLVTNGPYARVRHPLYLFEAIALFGLMLEFKQPWALLLFVAQSVFQLARMHYEEGVLAATFPEYHAYAARTARLIPGVY